MRWHAWRALVTIGIVSLLVGPFACGCASIAPPTPTPRAPPAVSLIPTSIDVDQLIPPAAAAQLPEAGERFDPEPIDGGLYCNGVTVASTKRGVGPGSVVGCRDLKPGILVDEVTFSRGIAEHSSLERTTIELRVLRDLRAKERALIHEAEGLYQRRIADLDQGVAQRDRWNEIRPWLGFAVGVAVTGLGAYAGARAVR